jgi:hypothetical protein
VAVVVVVEKLSLCTLVESKPKGYINVTHCFSGDKPAMISLLSMILDDKTDESALSDMSELFSSSLYIIVIPVDNHVHLLQ